MASNFLKSSSMIKLVYEIKDKKTIKIFDPYFINNNKNNCKTIINNKLTSISNKYEISDKNMKLLRVKLLILKNRKINLSCMFYKCESLKEFHLISEEEISKQEYKYENIKNQSENINTDNFYDSNNQSNTIFKNLYNNKYLIDIFNEDIKIYNMYNNYDGNNEKGKNNYMNNFRNESLLSSNSSIKSQNNNYNKYSLLNETSFSFNFWKIIRIYINRKELKKSKLERYNIISTNLRGMFYGCSSLLSITGLSKINTSNVKNMDHMFENCSKLKKINGISKWDTNNLKNISCMFAGCSFLKSLPYLSDWNTENFNSLRGLFSECSSLLSIPDISNWNIENISDLSYIFFDCTSIVSLPDISKWNTNNVIDMSAIFAGCSKLQSLPDISKWNTNNVNSFCGIFDNCSSLTSLPDLNGILIK